MVHPTTFSRWEGHPCTALTETAECFGPAAQKIIGRLSRCTQIAESVKSRILEHHFIANFVRDLTTNIRDFSAMTLQSKTQEQPKELHALCRGSSN
jgi:hypothetical protein